MHKNVTILSTLDLHLSNLSSTILKEFSLKRKVCSFHALAWDKVFSKEQRVWR